MAGMIKKSFDSPEEVRPFEQNSGKLRTQPAKAAAIARRSRDWASVFWIALNRGERAMSATLRVTNPRRTATSRAPAMTRWIS